MSELLVRRRDRLLELTLNRPPRNELNLALLTALRAALSAADADDRVDVVLLTGTDPAFCGGLDLAELASAEFVAAIFSSSRLWDPLSKPVVGAVNGLAERGGLELALSCDVLLASERATFADTHTRLGLVPSLGLTARLPRLVGPGWARRLGLTGTAIGAAEATRIGLVTEMLPHDELVPAARRLASEIADADRDAVRALLASYRSCADAAEDTSLTIELEAHRTLLRSRPADPVGEAILGALDRRGAASRGAREPLDSIDRSIAPVAREVGRTQLPGVMHNKQVVLAFLDLAFNERQPAEAVERYVGGTYIQHNPEVADGPQGLIAFVEKLSGEFPDIRFEFKRVIAEGDFVAVHIHGRRTAQDRGIVAIDVFRLEDGKVVEHWDAVQAIPETFANDNGMI